MGKGVRVRTVFRALMLALFPAGVVIASLHDPEILKLAIGVGAIFIGCIGLPLAMLLEEKLRKVIRL